MGVNRNPLGAGAQEEEIDVSEAKQIKNMAIFRQRAFEPLCSKEKARVEKINNVMSSIWFTAGAPIVIHRVEAGGKAGN